MILGDKNKAYFNESGCPDPTAYNAIKNVSIEEKELEDKAFDLIKTLKRIIDWAGFELLERIKVKHKKSGKEFK